MGWGGGTEIFDCVASELIDLSDSWTATNYHEGFMLPLVSLISVLEDKDWDNKGESDYWDDPVIGKLLGNTFEEDE